MMMIDLLAILPFYLPYIITVDLRVLRLLRLLRLARIFKLGRYTQSMNVFAKVFVDKKSELTIAAVFFGFYLIMSSSILYLLENEVQPEQFSSIPAAMWWGSAALTTVGYGDIYPVTPLGKFFGATLAIMGIAMFALPVGILATGFVEAFDEINEEKKRKLKEAAGELDEESEISENLSDAQKRIELLERLAKMHKEGTLNAEEFALEKARLN
jgi:voltage-gated potassium channel